MNLNRPHQIPEFFEVVLHVADLFGIPEIRMVQVDIPEQLQKGAAKIFFASPYLLMISRITSVLFLLIR